MKLISAIFLILYLLTVQNTSVYAEEFEPEIETAGDARPSPQFSAEAVVLMDAKTGLVLYGHGANTPMYPASITKVMTALIVLEQSSDLNERIEFSHNSIHSIPRSSAHISMDVGETLTIYEALYGLMLRSANEVAVALAEHVAGSVEDFVDLMNRRAVALGANNTHFANACGLPRAGHVTTAYDMSLIMREAVEHPIFNEIISTVRFDIPPTERQPDVRHLLNTNQMIRPGPYFNENVVGGKTGWTTPAGNTLVTYA
ncbi:MAG: serine hydrolase, partial [Defluviitaleaceae bacterium]|nr:serine hydrolase [Defluviitaleaceae bacterium]